MKAARVISLLLVAVIVGCDEGAASGRATREVIVFTAWDRVYSEPILQQFERETGIRVRPVYDAEAAKTTGLVNRLLARRDNPECDVLWNNEIVQTEALAQQGVLEHYISPSAARIPAAFRDPDGYWTGFAARLRVMVYNTQRFADAPPATLALFSDPAYRGQGVMALPYYGTTFTHIAALHQQWGEARVRQWLADAKANGTAFAPGNGSACELVASGERFFGLTDTDDANVAMRAGKPIAMLIPDPEQGAVLIPNTVAMIRGGPNPQEARRLIDYLLSKEVEQRLAEMASAQIPLGYDLQDSPLPWRELLHGSPPQVLPVKQIAESRPQVIELLRELGLGH